MVPNSLRRWFIAHFIADLLVALPLFLVPETLLGLLDWQCVDAIAARLVAAALFAIGIQSWLGRNAGPEEYRGMLNLKIIWSGFATVGLLWTAVSGGPWSVWVLLAIFLAFNLVWLGYRLGPIRSAP
jgi:hypothetical protein